MLVATHETVGWLRDKIGRFRLRQLNGAVMVLSGLAVVFVPIAMSSMHGDHGGGHSMGMAHGDTMMMTDTDNTTHHDMSQMDHSMHNMNNDSVTME